MLWIIGISIVVIVIVMFANGDMDITDLLP